MSASFFTLINSRIERWGTALVKACAAHPTATLRDLTDGPAPPWWTFFQGSGFDVRVGVPGRARRTATHEFVLGELERNSIEQAYTIGSSVAVISDIVDHFVANDHDDAKIEYERVQDPSSWIAPRNIAIPCFMDVRRALLRFMTRLQKAVASSEDGKDHDDPVDNLFFKIDQDGKSPYLLFRSMIQLVETEIYDYIPVCESQRMFPDIDPPSQPAPQRSRGRSRPHPNGKSHLRVT
jgi:hypothetical protein